MLTIFQMQKKSRLFSLAFYWMLKTCNQHLKDFCLWPNAVTILSNYFHFAFFFLFFSFLITFYYFSNFKTKVFKIHPTTPYYLVRFGRFHVCSICIFVLTSILIHANNSCFYLWIIHLNFSLIWLSSSFQG